LPQRVFRALACALLLSSLASPAVAHAALVSATPGPGDRISASPTELVAQFSQNLDPSRTSLEVRDASGTRVVRGGELGGGPREFRLDLPILDPGVYEVRWTTYSTEDGEIARDTYTFEVLAAPSPSPASTPTATPLSSASPSALPSPSPSPTPQPGNPSVSPSSAPDSGDSASGIDGSIVIPIVVALAAVGGFGLWALRRPRG
jgi:copper resistance protein C